ncbi:Transcription factor GTE3, chloroplastic [Ananas comosus]|uniref:Transcription factor GTE3, chloroplastic n=1 Tax=Ananas comosus TaxID=4615 RepID=A0A199UQ22_ANACO|nr:Transcription factor GTE3, chloroplastic [Ananas comosus]
MASAVIATRNEPCWGERKVYMRKTPIPNPNHSNPRPGALNSTAISNAGDRTGHPHGQFRHPDPEDVPISGTALSDDSSSFNRKSTGLNHRREPFGGDGSSGGGYVTFNISTYSRKELRDLRRRLVSELELVRSLVSRIESQDHHQHLTTRSAGFSSREVNASHGALEKRPYPSSDLPTKDKNAPREPKRLATAASVAVAPEAEKLLSAMMKKCGQILTKLMKNKKSVWFNSPVDVVGMGLHDYFQIIKHPMDLGSVKSKLSKGLYPSPSEFAADVRLTFNNALLYNPEGHEVHKLADQFLKLFDGLFGPSFEQYEKQRRAISRGEEEKPRVSSGSRVPMSESAVRPDPIPVNPSPPPPPAPAPAPAPALQLQLHLRLRLQLRAKDPNKRPMSFAEKQKLSLGLQSLPEEKMAQVLQIVRKRNLDPAQHGDEIELDIEMMDTETLWELDRFVCNCKKMMSKMRRQDAMNAAHPSVPHAQPTTEAGGGGDRQSSIADNAPDTLAAKKGKVGDSAAEEDVDIGDEMPSTNYPPVVIEKDEHSASSSGSSGSDSSSSSSDSESGSSSQSDSDEDDDVAQSPS